MPGPIVGKDRASQFAIAVVPGLVELLQAFQRPRNAFELPPKLRLLCERLNAYDYVRLYQSDNAIANALGLAWFGVDGFKEACAECERMSEPEQSELVDSLLCSIASGEAEALLNVDPVDAKRQLDALGLDEKKAAVMQAHFLVAFLLAAFHNYFAVMVHGAPMTLLVPAAIDGDREAFLKAVHIDRTVLRHHAYFREERERAVVEREADWLRQISYWEAKPALRGRIRYPGLWMLFAVLDGCRCLDVFSHEELLNLCDEAGLDRYQNRIEDVTYLTKRLQAFRKMQRMRGLSMP
jgi:hypothetical protein